MRRQRRAKIVATVGPASSSAEMLEKLFVAGVDVFRLNFSHGTHEAQKARLRSYPHAGKQIRPTHLDYAGSTGPEVKAWHVYRR